MSSVSDKHHASYKLHDSKEESRAAVAAHIPSGLTGPRVLPEGLLAINAANLVVAQQSSGETHKRFD